MAAGTFALRLAWRELIGTLAADAVMIWAIRSLIPPTCGPNVVLCSQPPRPRRSFVSLWELAQPSTVLACPTETTQAETISHLKGETVALLLPSTEVEVSQDESLSGGTVPVQPAGNHRKALPCCTGSPMWPGSHEGWPVHSTQRGEG